jgi:hypothetical protein
MKLVGYGLSQSGGATPSRDNLGTKRSTQAAGNYGVVVTIADDLLAVAEPSPPRLREVFSKSSRLRTGPCSPLPYFKDDTLDDSLIHRPELRHLVSKH